MQKGGLWLKRFDPCKGGLEKKATNFPVKIEFTCFSHPYFSWQKGGTELFLRCEGGSRSDCERSIRTYLYFACVLFVVFLFLYFYILKRYKLRMK